MAYPNDPVYWISMDVTPSNGIIDKITIPLIPYNRYKSLDWNYTRFLPDDVNYTGEYYYTPTRMNNPKVNIATKIANALSHIPYPNWVCYPYESQPTYYVVGGIAESTWRFNFQTSCSELPPQSWDADPMQNIEYEYNHFNKWETHWYRHRFQLGNSTFIHTEFSNDGVYIQKYTLNGMPCHGEGTPEPTPLQPSPTPIPSTLSYYKPAVEGMWAVVGLYKDTFDPENPSVDDIEDFAIITNVNHASNVTWNYFRLWNWENFIVHHEDDPDTPEPTEDEMEVKKPYVGQFFNRQYVMTIGNCETFATNLASLTGSIAPADVEDVIKRLTGIYGGFNGWLENIVDITIYPFDVKSVLTGLGARLLAVSRIRLGMMDYVISSGGDEVPCSAYRIADSNDIIFDLTSWTLISRKFNDFRDFPPYRSAKLYLPFIGVMDFDVTNYYGKYIKVKYAVDISNGGCRAFVCIASSSSVSDDGMIVASYDGQMGFHTPVTGSNWADYVNGITQALGNTIASSVSVGGQLATGGAKIKGNAIKGGTQSALQGVGVGGTDVATSLVGLNQAEHNAPMMTRGSSSPCLNNYTDFGCHFIWYEMKTTESSNLLQLSGYPSNKSGTLGSFSGFLSVSECELSCPKATERERNMIKDILTKGIHI